MQAVADAADDLIEFGRRYWDLTGIDTDGNAMWRHPLSEFVDEQGVSHRRSHVLAAAGVRADLAGQECARCGAGLSLRSRDDFQRYVDGRAPEACVECDPMLCAAIAREHTATAAQRRTEDRSRAGKRLALHAAREAWFQDQRAVVEAEHPIDTTPTRYTRQAPLPVELAALAALRYEPAAEVIPPATTWSSPLAPSRRMSEALLAACLRHDLLRVHPDSPVDVCRWRQTFQEALSAANDDPARIGSPESVGSQLVWACWYAPDLPSGGGREELAGDLQRRLAPDALTPDRQREAVELWSDLIVEETLRELAVGLKHFDLPLVPDRHQLRLRETAGEMAEVLSIAQCVTLVGRAVRGAGKAKHANPRVPAEKMSVHAVNRLVDELDRTIAAGFEVSASHPQDSFVGELSVLTRVFLGDLLGCDPWHASLLLSFAVMEPLTARPRRAADPAATILKDPRADPVAAYQALKGQELNTDLDVALLGAVDEVLRLVDRIRALTGDLRVALAAAICAAERLTAPVPVPDELGRLEPVGTYLTDLLLDAALSTVTGHEHA